ncbi:MAG: hypothetical protein C0513_09140 [Isosphaera sp.]|nr:hypothetical protein [Isosphaera sp.]
MSMAGLWQRCAAGVLAGAAAGLLYVLSFPDHTNQWWSWGALLVPAPLMALAVWVARGQGGSKSGRRRWLARLLWDAGPALGATLGVLPAWLYLHWFVRLITPAGYPALVVYLSAYAGVYVWALALVARARRDAAVASAVPGTGADAGAGTPLRRWRPPVALMAAGMWLALEYARGEWVLGGYPMYLLGHPTIEWWGPANPGYVLGGWFVSLVVVTPAACLAAWALGRRERAAALVFGGAVMAACAGSAAWAWLDAQPGAGGANAREVAGAGGAGGAGGGAGAGGAGKNSQRDPTRRVRVGVVQTSLPQRQKLAWDIGQAQSDLDRWLRLSEQAARDERGPVDLIVWPETMFPGASLDEASVRTLAQERVVWRRVDGAPVALAPMAVALWEVQRQLGVPMLVGSVAHDGLRVLRGAGGGLSLGWEARTNSVILLRGGRQAGRYDKRRLMPFGEYVPVAWRFRAVQDALAGFGAAGMRMDLDFGARQGVIGLELETGPEQERPRGVLRVAAPVCFEVTYPSTTARLAGGQEGNGPGRASEGAGAGAAGPSGGHRGVADLIVNPSNDGWFMDWDLGKWQFLLVARWRCVELRRPMVRAANTGVSAGIDRFGGVVSTAVRGPGGELVGPIDAEGVLIVELDVPAEGGGLSPAARLWGGSPVGWAAVVVSCYGLIVSGGGVVRGVGARKPGAVGTGR